MFNIESMVNWVINVITDFTIFDSFSDYFCNQIVTIWSKSSSWLRDSCISKWVILSDFYIIHCFLVDFSCSKTTSDIHNTHLMTKISPYLHTSSSKLNCSSKILSSHNFRTTMKMNSFNIDFLFMKEFHSEVDRFVINEVISKLISEITFLLVLIFWNSYSPKNIHVRSIFFNLDYLVIRVSYC